MKKHFIIVTLLLTQSIISFSQDSTVYIAKGRLPWSIKKYKCAELILRNDLTYHYEEISGDLFIDIADGKYEFRSDTLCLIRYDEFPTKKYINEGNMLIGLNEYSLGSKLKKTCPDKR